MNNAENDIIEQQENHIAFVCSYLLILHKHICNIQCNSEGNSSKKKKKRLNLYSNFMKKLITA